jgi:hypothetical protein
MDSLHLRIPKGPARRGKEAVHCWLVCECAFLYAFTLHSPVIALMGQGHQINTRVCAARLRPTRKLIPQPDLLKMKLRVCPQVCLHQSFKAAALVPFGKSKAAVFVEYLLKRHGGGLVGRWTRARMPQAALSIFQGWEKEGNKLNLCAAPGTL